MKNFTKKIFLLAIGMILSVGAYAQDAITHHWPELRFTIVNADGSSTDGVTYHIPGWDAWHRFPKGNALYVYSHLRVQKYEKTGVDPTTGKDVFKARLVTRYIVSPDNRLTVPTLNKTADEAPIWVKFEGHEEIGVKNIRGLQYSAVLGTETGTDGTNYNVDIIDEDLDTKIIVTSGTLAIPAQMTHAASGEIYNIDEIGDYALRQYARTTANRKYNYIQVPKLIIPKEITKIGRGAFFNNCHTKVIEFEEGSSIKDIPEFNFQDNTYLETITLPAGIENLYGTVLGGCPALKKITFKGATPPTLIPFEWTVDGVTKNYDVFESTTTAGATKPNQCIIEVPLHAAKTYVDSNDKFKEFPMSSKFTMNKAYVTFCSDLPFTFKQYNTANKTWNDGDVKAYYVVFDGVKDGKVTLTEITEAKKIPSTTTLTRTGYFGVVLNGTAQETYDIFYPNNLISDELQATENCMQGVVKETKMGGENPDMAMDTEHYTYFVLTDGKFLTVTGPGTFGAHKAFLMIEGSPNLPAGARELTISLPDETTGITTHEVQGEQSDAWYTLQGIQVQQPGKGIFIKSGKKYIIK